jgi:hypothetical protein
MDGIYKKSAIAGNSKGLTNQKTKTNEINKSSLNGPRRQRLVL